MTDSTMQAERAQEIRAQVINVLKDCYDPEIPVNIYDLGLIYDIAVDGASGTVHLKMTLTSPACPVAETLPPYIQARVAEAPGVTSATVEVVWDPPWTSSMMTPVARLQLGL
jgi:FeS assembly SUF system protein